MSRPDVTPFFDNATNTWTYLVADPATGEAVIIDAVLDYEPKGARVSHAGLKRCLPPSNGAGSSCAGSWKPTSTRIIWRAAIGCVTSAALRW